MQKFFVEFYQIITSRKLKILSSIALLLALALELHFLLGMFAESSMHEERVRISIVFLILIYFHLALFAAVFHRELLRVLKNFFTEKSHPINLAVFRIVLFWFLLGWNFPEIGSLKLTNLHFAPDGMMWVLKHHLIKPEAAIIAIGLFRFFCVTSLLGFFTRFSTIMATICGFYAMGAAQFLGKVNHYHHLVWFMAILAASRCGDVLSLDALLSAWRRKQRDILTPKPQVYYATPLRITWLLMGVIYFFPGYWKMMSGGIDWIVSDNLKYYLYYKWYEVFNFIPPFRIDQHPFLLKFSAFCVVFFELSFILFVIFPRTRWFVAVGGIIFHNMTNLFMKISFRSLQLCYVVFFDWHYIFTKLGSLIYKDELHLFYNKSSHKSTRKANVVQACDVFGRIKCIDKKYEKSPDDIVVSAKGRTYFGDAVNRMIAVYIPFFWPFLPGLFLPKGPLLFSKALRKLDTLLARLPEPDKQDRSAHFSQKNKKAYAAMIVGCILIVGNIYCGVNRYHSWPFSAYPAFSSILSHPYVYHLSLEAFDSKGNIISFSEEDRMKHMSRARLFTIHKKILTQKGNIAKDDKLVKLWEMWQEKEERLKPARKVNFYLESLTIVPEQMHKNPLKRRLILTIDLK